MIWCRGLGWMKQQRTEVFEEILRAPLKAVVRTSGFVRRVVERSIELPKRSEDTIVGDKG